MCWHSVGFHVLLALALAFVHAEDADEFDLIEPQATTTSIPAQMVPARDFATLVKEFIPFQNPDNFVIEASSWGFGVLFVVLYVVGKHRTVKLRISGWRKQSRCCEASSHTRDRR
ncbi:unnamed protein product [Peronospora destructor]|uniref:Uncharacterized protein n=1 Tax=Peronospora destructor TaxID=86335 RepID=A0AAV0V9H3_9STRA|nr:unnamed protein product [Peronospora destructor]